MANFWDLVEKEKKKQLGLNVNSASSNSFVSSPTGEFGKLVDKYRIESSPYSSKKKKKDDDIAPVRTTKSNKEEDYVAPINSKKLSQFFTAAEKEDFKAKSGYVGTKAESFWDKLSSKYGLGYTDLQYEYINNQNGIRDEIAQKARSWGSDTGKTSSSYEENALDYMKPDEIAVYNYYYHTKGKEKAQEFLDALAETLSARKAGKEFTNIQGKTAKEIAYGVVGGAEQFEQGVKNLGNMIVGKDDYIPQTSTQILTGMIREDLADDGDGINVLGNSLGQVGFDALNTGANMIPSIVVGAANPVAGAILMGGSAAGNAYQQDLNEGNDKNEARLYATTIGTLEGVLQYLLGGIGKLGGTSAYISNAVSSIKNGGLRFALEYGGKIASEAFEEGLQEVLDPIVKNAIHGTDENIDWENAAYSALLGGLMGGVFGAGEVRNSHLSNDEVAVVNKATDALIAEREKKYGRKLTNKEKTEAAKEVRENLEHGGLEIDSIAEILGGESYEAFKAESDSFFGSDAYKAVAEAERNESLLPELQKRYDELNAIMPEKKTGAQQNEEASLLERIQAIKNAPKSSDLKAKIDPEANKRLVESYRKMHEDAFARVKDSRLAESYREHERSQQKLEIDINKYTDENARKTVQAIIDSGLGDNSNAFKNFLDLVAQVSAKHKSLYFDMTNNKRLFGTEHSRDGLTTNGYKLTDENGTTIVINKDAANPLRVVVGHEFAHVLEKSGFYDAMADSILKFAELKEGKKNLDARIKEAERIYKDDKNTTPQKEVVADLIGEYVFTDYEFISNLAKTNRQGFMKLFDEVKYLARIATAGSKEARELAKAKNNFERAYRENGGEQKNTATESGVQHSLRRDIVDVNGKEYDMVVELDREVSKSVLSSPKRMMNWIKDNLVGFRLPVLDENGNTEIIEFAGAKETTHKNNSKDRNPVLGELAHTTGDVRKSVVVNLLEVTNESVPDPEHYSPNNNHGWLDENGWKPRKTYVLAQDGNIYEAQLRIAKARDGRNILYAVNLDINEGIAVDKSATQKRAAVIAAMPSGKNISQPAPKVKTQHSFSKDSEGNQLSDGQKEFFKDSKAVDKDGNLLKVYHTTNNDFTVFDHSKKGETTGDHNTYLGFFFADDPEYMSQFPEFENGKTETYYLNMKNPIDINNISRQAFLDIVEATGGDIQEAAEHYDQEYADELKRAKFRGDNSPIMEMSRLLEDLTGEYFDYAEFYNALKPNYDQLMSKGYDGIINSLDGRGWANEYIVLDSNQAKLTSNKNPTVDPDVRYSLTEYTEEEKIAHNKAVIDYFGKTYRWAETGYILLDGSKLDLSGKHEGAPGGYRTVDHRDIVDALGSDYGDDTYSGSLVQFMSEGNIRISPESDGINLSVKPNKAQEAALTSFIQNAHGEVMLDIDDGNGFTVVSVEYPSGTSAFKVLNDIRGWFDNGTEPQVSNLSQFRYSLSEQTEYAPTFFSQMARVVDDTRQQKLGATSVVNMLRGKGVKAEEIKWSGIEEWLNGKKSVTKEELQEFIKGSQLQIEETVLGNGDGTISYTEDEQHDLQIYTDTQSRRMDWARRLWREAYGEEMPLVIEGADDVSAAISREIIARNGGIRDFAGVDAMSEAEQTLYTEVCQGLHITDLWIAQIRERAEARQKNTSETHWGQYKLDGGENYREYLFKMPGSDYRNPAMDTHWIGERGVLAHARVQDFDTTDGKMLFIEEIQSDWHNEGAKEGYDTKTAESVQAEQQRLFDRVQDDTLSSEERQQAYRELRDFEREHQIHRTGKEVPDAPFSKTYHEYVLKRLIREAAEKGYDSVGWTTADIQSDRWSNEYAEGYRIEYDQDIPKFLNKYGKKWGAQVGKTDIQTKHLSQDEEANLAVFADILEDGEDYIRNKKGVVEVWTMPITEAMKQSVLYEGQPQYSLSDVGKEESAESKFLKYTRGAVRRDTFADKLAEFAPVREDAVTEENTVTQEAAPVVVAENETPTDLFPDDLAPIDAELDSLIQRKEALEIRMTQMGMSGDFSDFGQVNDEYIQVERRIAELEQEAADLDSARMDGIVSSEAPPEIAPIRDHVADMIPLTKKAAADIARDVRTALALNNRQMADVHNIIQKYSDSEFPSREQLFQEIKEKFGTYTESITDETIKEAKNFIRKYRLNVSDSVKKEIPDYADIMRKNRGRILFANDGMDVNSFYVDELTPQWPHLFPESIDNQTNQFNRIVEVANMDASVEEVQHLDDESILHVADSIIQSVSDYKQAQKLKQANKYAKESFNGLLQNADEYVPPVNLDQVLRNRRMPVGTNNPDAPVAEIYDTQHKKGVAEGQQAMWEEPVSESVTRKVLHERIVDNMKSVFHVEGYDFDEVLKKAKDLPTFATVDNTPQRVMEKALGYKEGQVLSDITVNKVAQNETEGIRWLNSFTDRKNGLLAKISKQYNIKPGSKESAAAQMYAEGFFVNDNNEIIAYGDAELAKDFPDANTQNNIKKLARDPRIRQIYDETLAMINESRTRNAYPEIPRLDNYFLHFRAMEDTFSRIGLPFNPNDISAKDLPTDLNGVTADLKPGQPYFASAMHRKGKRTSFDLLGGLERYLTSAKNQIYHIDDIQNLRALRNYIADTYGQAKGLEGLDSLSEEEAQERIEEVYNSHLSTFAKFLNEEANVLAGKTALIDRGFEGVFGRRGITFINTVNQQVGKNMVGFNVSSSLTNITPVFQAVAKTNKFDFVKGFAQMAANKISSIFGKSDGFAESSPVIIRRKGADSFYRTPYQKVGDLGYGLMSAVDDIATELIARTKYNELTRKGMDSKKAHLETDKWVSRLLGDRSLGQQPQLYNSKMLGLFTKFQLEVRNQLDSQFYDTIQEAKVSNEEIQNKLLRNAKTAAKVTSTFVQLAVLQHIFGKAFESVAGYNPAFDIIDVLIKTFGWDDDEEDEDTVWDNVEEGFLALLGDLPYTSTLTGGRIPISSALPIKELVQGKDQYGNEKSRWKTAGEALPYYLLPGGYGQLKKTKQGLSMFDEDHPIAGSYTNSGNLRFPVEDTFRNRVQAAVFGQYASENARYYFDNDIAPLNEKQIQEYKDVDIPIRDYWDYRKGLKGKDTLGEKLAYIDSLDLPIRKQNILANNISDRKEPINMADWDKYDGLEEYDYAKKYPEKYQFLEANGISVEEYNSFDDDTKDAYSWAYQNPEKYLVSKAVSSDLVKYRKYASDLNDIRADKDASGKSISGSAKEKKINYLNSLDIDYGARMVLFKMEYPSDDTYNKELIEYLDSRADISYEDTVTILRELGFTVTDDGTVLWD